MKIKNLIAELQKLNLDGDVYITDIDENIYTNDFDILTSGNNIKIILPLNILDHDWREDIADEMYK